MEKKEKKSGVKKFGGFFILGVITTLIELVFYTISARIINNNDILWISALIGGLIGTVFAFILNSRLIWKNSKVAKREIIIFFVYNIGKTFTLKTFFTWVFGFLKPVYEFAFSFSSNIGLPFDYEFIESTGVFAFTALVCMMITYFTYDRIVFKNKKDD
ncbi:GtrA family protein [Candidatus Saccharibacteria bacterium]|nr:GtrA family protein [Candidatus Saccharibacteria bacterium]